MGSRLKLVGAVAAGLALVALAALWLLRFRLAGMLVEERLAKAQVPASYRITRVDPFVERLEDVRIGSAEAPDLTARRVEVTIGYGLGGARVARVVADGVRLRARIDAKGLHLGALDRLLPRGRKGGPMLPDLRLAFRDAHVALATPNGALALRLDGAGNPARTFAGQATAAAAVVRLGGCMLHGMQATLAIRTTRGMPQVTGPIALAGVACPTLALGPGRIAVTARSTPAFDRVALAARPAGFGGSAGPARFAAVAGQIDAHGRIGALAADASIRLQALRLPAAARAAASARGVAAGTPIADPVARAATATAHLLEESDAQAQLHLTLAGTAAQVGLRALRLTDAAGGWVALAPRGGIGWGAAGWRIDGTLATGGGALPQVQARIAQARTGAPLTIDAALAPYAAGAGRLAVPRLAARWDGARARLTGTLVADGPLAGGRVAGLVLPIDGIVRADGAYRLGEGCRTLAARTLTLAGFTFAGPRLPVCGDPLLRGGGGGPTTIRATAGPLDWAGRTRAGAPVAVHMTDLALTDRRFTAHAVTATLGETRLAIGTLAGSAGGAGLAGTYADADAQVAHVPLRFDRGAGRWTLAGGRLALDGVLGVRDTADPPRFRPLVSDDFALTLADNRIAATATLQTPDMHAAVTRVALVHALADGTGHATLDVPALTFAPKRLQPDMITPLTLGVIANVAGTITGHGRIDWGASGVTSTGTFATDHMDLAAAFGPVTGIKGRIDFTDLLGLKTAPNQLATIAQINPGVPVGDGTVRYQLIGDNRVTIAQAHWPFAGGTLTLDPTTITLGANVDRRLTFRIRALDAARFVQQLDFPNIDATGTFDGVLPMVFDQQGGRIERGAIAARPPGGTLAYVGELTTAKLGTMGKLAFDALKAIRYSTLTISLDGRLDGEMVSRVRFTGVRQATGSGGLVARLIRNLPFRFTIDIRAPFRGLIGSARSYADPRLLLNGVPTNVQTPASEDVR